MTMIIYDHVDARVYADRHRFHVGQADPSDQNKLDVPREKRRVTFQSENHDTGVMETVLVMTGTGNVQTFQHAHWLVSQGRMRPAEVVDHFLKFAAGSAAAVKNAKALFFTDRQIIELGLSSGEVIYHPYGHKRLYWGSGAGDARMFDELFTVTPAQLYYLCNRSSKGRISQTFSVVQGLPQTPNDPGHDILLHATAPWPDDLTTIDVASFQTRLPSE